MNRIQLFERNAALCLTVAKAFPDLMEVLSISPYCSGSYVGTIALIRNNSSFLAMDHAMRSELMTSVRTLKSTDEPNKRYVEILWDLPIKVIWFYDPDRKLDPEHVPCLIPDSPWINQVYDKVHREFLHVKSAEE